MGWRFETGYWLLVSVTGFWLLVYRRWLLAICSWKYLCQFMNINNNLL
jgi:hypothetical protein